MGTKGGAVMHPKTLQAISEFIFVSDEPMLSDVIMIPGCSSPEVAELAAGLWKAGYSPLVVPTGKYSIKRGSFRPPTVKRELYPGPYRTECEFFTDVLRRNGVPESAILGEDCSTYTRENAVFAAHLLHSRGICVRRAILCTKAYHARRCQMYFAEAFPQAELLVCTVDTLGIGKDTWHHTALGVECVMGELERCGSQFVESFAAEAEAFSESPM